MQERQQLFEILIQAHNNYPFNFMYYSELLKINNQITLQAYKI